MPIPSGENYLTTKTGGIFAFVAYKNKMYKKNQWN